MGLRETKKEQRRVAIEEAARHFFIEEGFERCSVEKIAAATDMARGTFYLYFPDKITVFETLAERLYSPLVSRLEIAAERLAQAQSASEQQVLYAQMAWEIGGALEEAESLVMLHFREAWCAGPAGDCVRQWRSRIETVAAQVLEDAVARGFVRPHDTTVAAMAIVGAGERMIWAWLESGSSVDRTQVSAELADLFWRGIHGGGRAG